MKKVSVSVLVCLMVLALFSSCTEGSPAGSAGDDPALVKPSDEKALNIAKDVPNVYTVLKAFSPVANVTFAGNVLTFSNYRLADYEETLFGLDSQLAVSGTITEVPGSYPLCNLTFSGGDIGTVKADGIEFTINGFDVSEAVASKTGY